MLTTTYQYDYVPPLTRIYPFIKHNKRSDEKQKGECRASIEKHSTNFENRHNVEWTGVAPTGPLIDPRIIPTEFSKEQLDPILKPTKKDCFKEQPNRFLKILQTTYPDLYDRLKEIPNDKLYKRLERDRMCTTYQIDFCNINEYPNGIYESLKVENETSQLNGDTVLQEKEPCKEFRAKVMEDITKANISRNRNKTYIPFKASFADSSHYISSGDSSHWRNNIFTKNIKFSEYMDTINRNGCVIMKNKIHNHQKCTKQNCRHVLTKSCTNLK